MVWFTLHDWGEKTMRLNELFKESGYNHGHADPRAPQLGSDEKRERKHAELQHELGHERNNIAIAINGKTWKVILGRGHADSKEEWQYLNNMKTWAEKKSSSSGKKWTVHLTGAEPTNESVTAGGMGASISPAVANPTIARSKKKIKSVDALSQNKVSLFGGPMEGQSAVIKR